MSARVAGRCITLHTTRCSVDSVHTLGTIKCAVNMSYLCTIASIHPYIAERRAFLFCYRNGLRFLIPCIFAGILYFLIYHVYQVFPT